ncbi:roadblock/LC7 domain-containing protein [Nocardia colli]|uniref:roadblock/LC7 domain-containing protein n=1 Tax=Nocardia colli TaxID=2545717 RepID=UPI0035E0F3C0
MTYPEQGDLDRLLDDLTARLSCVRHAVVVTAEGLPRSRSADLTYEQAEYFCALAAVLHNLARTAGSHFGVGNARQSMIELDHGYLVIAAIGTDACLAVLTEEGAAMGFVAFEMNRTVRRLARMLSPA